MSTHLVHGVTALIALYTQTIAAGEAIRQGTQTAFGDCLVGGGEVSSDRAQLDTFDERTGIETTQLVRKGQLLFVCGAFHRVLDLVELPSNGLPGGDPSTAYVAARAVKTSKLHPGAVVLTIGGRVDQFGPRRASLSQLALASIARGLMARFTVSFGDVETSVGGVAGDFVAVGTERHRITAVTPPHEATGVPGWVEIDLRPQNRADTVSRRCKR